MFNTINGVTTPQNVNFKSKNIQKVETTDNIEPAEKDKGLSSTAKWAIGLGLAGLASCGIYAMTKGRVKAPKPTPANPIPEIKEMAVNAFREAGNKFEKGKAILADGTKYTGNITSTGKDGSKVVMEYVDGVLQKSTKTAKDGTKVFEKAYIYSEFNGELTAVKKDGKNILQKFGNGVRLSDGYYKYNFDKNLITVSKTNGSIKGYEYINGKRILRTEALPENPKTLIFYRDDGSREFVLKNCHITPDSAGSGTRWRDNIEVYDNKGKLIKTLGWLDDGYDTYREKYINWFENMC